MIFAPFWQQKSSSKAKQNKEGAIKNKGTLVPVAPRLLSGMLMVKPPSKLFNNRQHGKAKTCFTGTFCLSFSAAQNTFSLVQHKINQHTDLQSKLLLDFD